MKAIDKDALARWIRGRIEAELAVAVAAARDAAAAATHEEARPENDKDTRGLEASYLARGQAERVRDLEAAALAMTRLKARAFAPDAEIGLGALVEIVADDADPAEKVVYFVAPAGGGLRTTIDGVGVLVVTPSSPLGRALVGHRVGDVVEIVVRGKPREHEIADVG